MKKLISLLAALGLGATGASSVVSCEDDTADNGDATAFDLSKAKTELGEISPAEDKASDDEVIAAFVSANSLTDVQKADLVISDNDGSTTAKIGAKDGSTLITGDAISVTYTLKGDTPAPSVVSLSFDGKIVTQDGTAFTAVITLTSGDEAALGYTADVANASSIFVVTLDPADSGAATPITVESVAFTISNNSVTVTTSAAITKDAKVAVAAVDGKYNAASFTIKKA